MIKIRPTEKTWKYWRWDQYLSKTMRWKIGITQQISFENMKDFSKPRNQQTKHRKPTNQETLHFLFSNKGIPSKGCFGEVLSVAVAFDFVHDSPNSLCGCLA